MKLELYIHGPISCALEATKKLEQYEEGIYSEKKPFPSINHEISLVGW